MKVQITGRHLEKSEAINNFILEKFKKIDQFFNYPLNCHVILNVEKNLHSCEAKIKIKGGMLFAKNHSDNMYASIDGILDKLINQAKRYQEKQHNHGHMIPKKELADEIAHSKISDDEDY